MTPYYYKTSQEDAARLERLSALETEVQFELLLYAGRKAAWRQGLSVLKAAPPRRRRDR